jgi:hypothetical protein
MKKIAESTITHLVSNYPKLNHDGYLKQFAFSTIMTILSQEKPKNFGDIIVLIQKLHEALKSYEASCISRIIMALQDLG